MSRIARSPLALALALTAAGTTLAACGMLGRGGSSSEPRITTAVATLRTADARTVGTATLSAAGTGVLVSASITGLGSGTHAMHVHAVGRCEPTFAAAGAHLDLDGHRHGFRNASGPHTGDLPNVHGAATGSQTVDFFIPNVTLAGEKRAILDKDGAALVIHASADDYLTDPSGNSGDRIACGVIQPR